MKGLIPQSWCLPHESKAEALDLEWLAGNSLLGITKALQYNHMVERRWVSMSTSRLHADHEVLHVSPGHGIRLSQDEIPVYL